MRARSAAGVAGTVLALLAGSAVLAGPAGALPATTPAAALIASPDGNGYAVVSAAGKQYDYGSSRFSGQLSDDVDLRAPVVGAVDVPHGTGSWVAIRDGGVFAVGGARSLGSLAGSAVDPDVTQIVATPSGAGYWLVTSSGRVAGFGDARTFGDLASLPHEGPVVAMAATPSGAGYWLVTSAGSVVGFGDAVTLGSPLAAARERSLPDPAPLVAVLSSATGKGYLAVASDGSTFSYGDFVDPGTLAGLHLTSPVVAAAPSGAATGVWLLTGDGGVIALHAPFYGSIADEKDPHPTSVVAPVFAGGVPTVDGAAGGLVAIPCRGGSGIIAVSALLARNVSDLLTAADADGIGLCATSSFRNSQQQIALRRQYCSSVFDPAAICSRPVALPGRSEHEQGLAVDFSASPAGYAWLLTNAPRFGLVHLKAFGPQTEPWHFSINGG